MNQDKNLLLKETFALAVQAHKKNNLDGAQDLYKQVLKINPKYFTALNNLGVIYKNLKDYQKSQECFEKAVEINPNFLSAHYNLGTLFDILGEIQKQITAYEEVIRIDPNYVDAYINLATVFLELSEFKKSEYNFKKALKIDPDSIPALNNLVDVIIGNLDDFEKSINLSQKSLRLNLKKSNFLDESVSLFRLKHDCEQANYLTSKNYEIEGIEKFQKVSDEILSRSENKENENNYDKKIFLNKDEINDLLPFYRSDYTYKTKKISGSCINPNKNWQEVEDKYLNGSNQIIYIDDFLSEEALQELREFCLVSKVWNREYKNKYLGAFSNSGFISPIHLQIAIDLKKQLPKLFGPHRVAKIWGFKYDSKMGKGINVHADAAIHNLNFWITPDEYNNNKNSGGLKVYDTPAPEKWSFEDYNSNKHNIYQFLKDNNANCTNVSYKSNRAVLFNSSYFRETDEIDFKDEYEGRRIANTYLFGSRGVEKK